MFILNVEIPFPTRITLEICIQKHACGDSPARGPCPAPSRSTNTLQRPSSLAWKRTWSSTKEEMKK